MTKKSFIALANAIRSHNNGAENAERFTQKELDTLADFCQRENPNFMRDRWFDYIAGKCGQNGGAIRGS